MNAVKCTNIGAHHIVFDKVTYSPHSRCSLQLHEFFFIWLLTLFIWLYTDYVVVFYSIEDVVFLHQLPGHLKYIQYPTRMFVK